ncbi:MAG TPA: sensor histidine kinase [Pseudonocardiaceae bacterium]|nr:sensor histidine kinase [Pseudonocardiaceae bacterium]
MGVVGTTSSGGGPAGPGRRWFRRRIGVGPEGAGHLVGILALICTAAYGVLIVSQSIEAVHLYPNAAQRAFGFVGWVLWGGSYLWAIVSVLRGRRHVRSTQVVAVAGMVWSIVLMIVMGGPFAALPDLSFAVMALSLSGRVRGFATAVTVAVYLGLTTQEFSTVSDVRKVMVESAVTALIFYAIPRLVIFAGELEDTRSELAQLAVSEQRLRWARDLHDTLGHGLSVVVLKLELVERLSVKNPERAIGELRDARELLRESIGEMQTVVAGMRDVSLRGEIANACTILNSAGVSTTVDITPVVLDNAVAEALAWIVREGSTNVLRHSDSTQCSITLRVDRGRAVLTLTNDGPAIQVTRAPSGGHGIRGMRERLNTLGGRLTAKSERDGGFVLEASVPLPADPADAALVQPVVAPGAELPAPVSAPVSAEAEQ